jgi:anti-sigma-K factor RskA
MTRPLSDEDIILAGEYVLGLLEGDEEMKAADRLATDDAFAAEVATWQQRLVPLLAAPPEPASAKMLEDIRAHIGAAPNTNSSNQIVRLWQGVAGAAVAAAASLALFVIVSPDKPPTTPAPSAMMVAALASETGKSAMTVAYQPDRAELLVTPVAFEAPGRYPELWLIDGQGNAQSLGFVDAGRATRIAVDPALRAHLKHGMSLAVTLEADRNAPHAKAAGPVIVSGTITQL